MPMFGRRSRSVSVSRPITPSATSPAMLAASQAFMGQQGPQTKLATGAAAAALRSMSPASTQVGQVQTKRMVERQNSVGSTQNAQRGRSRGNNLIRRSSSSSMTERTFREPSPGRPSTSNGTPASRQQEPPVPQVPANYANVPPVPVRSYRRSASIDEVQDRKTASRKPAADPRTQKPTNPTSAAAQRSTSGTAPPDLDRNDSRDSVNFSYPSRARPLSPPPQRQHFSTADATLPVPQGISATEARNIQHDLAQTAQQPVKKKKKRDAPLSEGSHLSSGTMGSKPVVTPLAPGPSPQQSEPELELGKGAKTARLTGEASHFPSSPTSPTDSTRDPDPEVGVDDSKQRRNQRASGYLHKQPSVVREDWEGEQEDPSSPSSVPPTRIAPAKRQTPEANVSRKIEGGVAVGKPDQGSETHSSSQNLSAPAPRTSSLSPSRSTRFSKRLSSDITEGQKHEPPPRSVSPRKSVLKHSHSPQLYAVDARRRESSLSLSETTDTSTDGAPRRKKHAHVSFDANPAVVSYAAESKTPISPQVASPQNRDQEKKWYNLPKKTNRVILSEDSDDEDTMKPRPQLPTFGSVRNGRRNEVEPSANQQISSSPLSSSSSSISSGTGPTTMETSISSDHVIGAIFARESEHKKSASFSPVSDQTTPIEGTGIHSHTENPYSRDNDDEAPRLHQSVNQSVTMSNDVDLQSMPTTYEAGDVPSIAVLPATPGTEDEQKHQDKWLVEVPGGFPGVAPDSSYVSANSQATIADSNARPDSNTLDDVETRTDRMPSIQEEDSDRDSVYSDAAEDLSDLEGDGFGSINAIVKSPVPHSPTAQANPPHSPVVATPQRDSEEVSEESPASWDNAVAKWKSHKELAQQASLQPAAPIVESKPQSKPVVKAARRAASNTTASPASTVSSVSTSAATPTPADQSRATRDSKSSGFKKSMRPEPEGSAPTTMRPTARSSAIEEVQKPLRSSMRQAVIPAAPAPVAKAPPQVTGTLQKKNLRTAPTPTPAPRQTLPPVNNDSDSESSFRRRRRAKANDGGRYSMKRSMRSGGAAESESAHNSRKEVRSMSPVARRPFSPAGGSSTMRTTMRGSIDNTPTLRGNTMRGSVDNTPTLRGNNGEKRSSSLFGRRKEVRSPTRPMSAGGFNKSRIVDSDDEGATRPKVYKSRFNDSSDDEADLRPVRGIPRTTRADNSTDLEDSSDEERRKSKKASQQKQLSITVPSPPPERPMSPASPDGKKKRGLFGRLKKSKDETASPVGPVAQSPVNGKPETIKPGKRSANTAALGFNSNAEREALVEQTRKKLETAKEQPQSPARGKLQRRVTPQRAMSESWPLPPKMPDNNTQQPDRPLTSDGSGATDRPALDDRQLSPGTGVLSPAGEVDAKSGKKKRFPMLRKAFGLKD